MLINNHDESERLKQRRNRDLIIFFCKGVFLETLFFKLQYAQESVRRTYGVRKDETSLKKPGDMKTFANEVGRPKGWDN